MNATTSEPLPAIPDLETGLRRISDLPLRAPEQALAELNRILDDLARTPPAADIHLEVLEQLRTPLCFVAEELARGYVNKALPLGIDQERRFRQVAGTWRTVAYAYRQRALMESDAQGAPRLALGLQRSMSYSGLCIMEHYRARREPPHGVWQEMHASYALAETHGVANTPVADTLDPRERSTHCASALVSALLTELAGPYGLSFRDLILVRHWADNWAPLVGLHRLGHDKPLPPFVIDLQQDAAFHEHAEEPAHTALRNLDLSRLTLQVRELLRQLKHKAAPSEIGLGEDCTAGQCRRLLEHLATVWSRQLHEPRKYRRRPATGHATVCSSFDAMHFFISGAQFTPPEKHVGQTHDEYERLFAFPQMVESGQTLLSERERLGLTSERWEIVNQSANGFRLRRAEAGKPIVHGQLLAIRPQEDSPFLLARVKLADADGQRRTDRRRRGPTRYSASDCRAPVGAHRGTQRTVREGVSAAGESSVRERVVATAAGRMVSPLPAHRDRRQRIAVGAVVACAGRRPEL
ncbi:MAG: hypothetical protein QM739_11120 [Propionivibrio sp.]